MVGVVSTHLNNMLVNLHHFPKDRGEHTKMFETTTYPVVRFGGSFIQQKTLETGDIFQHKHKNGDTCRPVCLDSPGATPVEFEVNMLVIPTWD